MEGDAFVLDLGSGFVKAGFAGEEAPRSIFPHVYARPTTTTAVMVGMGFREGVIGDEAVSNRSRFTLRYPVKRGVVVDWWEEEAVLAHIFSNELRIPASERPVLLTEQPMNPRANRERLFQILFEKFGTPRSMAAMPAVLALYASGRTTGIVLDSGDGVTTVLPMYEGHCWLHAVARQNFAGEDVTEFLVRTLQQHDQPFRTAAEFDIARDMKEKLCYVPQDCAAEAVTPGKKYELPDGHVVTLGEERFGCPEILFNPAIVGRGFLGFHELLWRAINSCDVDIRKDLCRNVILSGGNTLFPGFPERLSKELDLLASGRLKFSVSATPDRKYFPWIGGSILASLTAYQDSWVKKSDYEESGPSLIHQRCPW